MPNWNEGEFVRRAQELAQKHVVSKVGLNDLAEKVARDENLNPDEIRTLVRLANVATFQELFKRKDDGDKMVEFDTGDPESVIRRIVDDVKSPPQSASVDNDKLAHELPDMMRAKRAGHPEFTEANAEDDLLRKSLFESGAPKNTQRSSTGIVEKQAAHAKTDLVILNLRKLATEFEIEKISAGRRWEDRLDAITSSLKRAPGYGPSYADFEKNAVAEFGEDVLPELSVIAHDLRLTHAVPAREKIAFLQLHHAVESSRELTLLKEAVDARHAYLKYRNGLDWVSRNTPKLGRGA